MRGFRVMVILIAASMACSRDPERNVAATPTAPSAGTPMDTTIRFGGGISGPMDVLFPSRSDAYEFRNQLETKYQTGLGRPLNSTYVDREGEVVWTQEYIRYRANGCDHGTANDRVMRQIDGGAPSGICQAPSEFSQVLYPSRADVFEFRRALEIKYQQMGRGLTTSHVDMEGSVIWIQEYLRYRTNSCDHATSVTKVFAQIDGGPVAATCFVPCSYRLSPENFTAPTGASTQSVELRPDPVACPWTAESTASWLTISTDYRSGTGFTNIPYTIGANFGAERTGRIRFTFATGSVTHTVTQPGTPFVAGFTLVDPFRSINETNECWIRSTSTPCNFTAYANLPGNGREYRWSVSYVYDGQEVITLISGAPTFSFSDACGLPGSTAEGADIALSVQLIILDDVGNSVTIIAGTNRPALTLKAFTCGS